MPSLPDGILPCRCTLLAVRARRLRLDALDELIANEDFTHNVDGCLAKLPKDLDKCDASTPAVSAVPCRLALD